MYSVSQKSCRISRQPTVCAWSGFAAMGAPPNDNRADSAAPAKLHTAERQGERHLPRRLQREGVNAKLLSYIAACTCRAMSSFTAMKMQNFGLK